MVDLRCQCCGFRQKFAKAKEAFDEGWDCPPFFTQVVTCPLCPSSPLILKKPDERHLKQHAKWEADGRPKDFDTPSIPKAKMN